MSACDGRAAVEPSAMTSNAKPADELPWEIEPTEAAALLRAGEARMIDVREPDEWAVCRIEGSELLPLGRVAAEAGARLPDPGARILVTCHHGMRSLHAVQWLRARGWDRAQSVAGGVDRWAEEIDPAMARY